MVDLVVRAWIYTTCLRPRVRANAVLRFPVVSPLLFYTGNVPGHQLDGSGTGWARSTHVMNCRLRCVVYILRCSR